MKVFMLWHIHKMQGEEEAKLIGVYSTRAKARASKARLLKAKGFRDHPRGFKIYPRELDRGEWSDGFITVRM